MSGLVAKPRRRRSSVAGGPVAEVAALAQLSYPALQAEWRRLYRSPPPKKISRNLLEVAVAWKLQEKAVGGLSRTAKRQLEGLAEALGAGGEIAMSRAMAIKTGARLLREWNGEMHEVLALAEGFQWRGRRWASLSTIAREITGTRWSGPRFFGLRPGGKDPMAAASHLRLASRRSRLVSKKATARGTHKKAQARCAIYTRKSSEEGLEHSFNSLDAQRETCEAYVLSQRHEGWTALSEMYDDGGVSGGTLDRPALKRLLADIAAGKVDTVVVYKVDRLTRSLADFAKIVDLFEKHGVTFVSVTQPFNTTTSMGRLTLNMLLSFAQFEREVAGERIRDKIAASKQKGMWMGGLPPLGYEVLDRKLVIQPEEAETVRHIFRRYVELGSVQVLGDELRRAGILSKRRRDRFGRESGGKPLSRGALYLMLQNRLYRGEIVHKGTSYPGQHEALVDEALWDAAQSRLAGNRVDRRTGAKAAEPSLLVGLAYDEAGERMTPTHANKQGRRYRYYVSHSLIGRGKEKNGDAGLRVPAGDLERLVETRIVAFLGDSAALYASLEAVESRAGRRQAMIREAAQLAERWSTLSPSDRRAILHRLIERIVIRRDSVEIAMRPGTLPFLLAPDGDPTRPAVEAIDAETMVLSVPVQLRRAGKEMRLLIDGPGPHPQTSPDRSLLRLLGQAHRFQAMVMRGDSASITVLAEEAGVGPSYFTRVLKLSFLSPKLVEAIVEGRQPAGLNAKSLTRDASQLASAWSAQAVQLRIA